MPVRPIRSPRRVVGLFLALVLVPSGLLVWLGWRLFEQDRTVSQRGLEERRRQTADLVVAILDQALLAEEKSIRDGTSLGRVAAHGDAAVIVIDRGRMAVAAGGRVAWLPVPALGQPIASEPFADADEWSKQGESDRARAKYRELSHARDPSTRAGALLRLAKGATPTEWLDLFARMASIHGASIEDLPVELFARVERCRRLEELGRPVDRGEATAIRDGLLDGRWPISRRVYDANLQDARRWAGPEATPHGPTMPERLASAVDAWWASGGAGSRSGRRFLGDEIGATLLWTSEGERRILLAALPTYVEREWVAATTSLAARQNARIATRDPATRASQASEERRSAADTDLPWTIVVADADAASELARLAGRRSLWLAGLGALILLLGAGAYLVTRAVSRELAVARLQSDFVAAVSHEFRTPLTSMRQLTEILVDERVTDGPRRRSYYFALARQTDRLHRLVESLLNLGRLESGRSPYRLEPLDACALVRSVVDDFRRDAAGHDVRIELDLDGDAHPVAGDRDALTNALWNLLDNAVKYSPDCRTVWVSVEREANRLLIRVRDRGIGIPREEQRAIFDKFVRGVRAKADGFKGTGIGLSMVRHIVRAHGGDVAVQSAPGDGSTFTLTLPLI